MAQSRRIHAQPDLGHIDRLYSMAEGENIEMRVAGGIARSDHGARPSGRLSFILRTARIIARNERVPVARQFAQMGFLYLACQLGPMQYYEARLWSSDYTMKQKMRFMSGEKYHRRISELNPPSYQKLSQHKLAEKALLTLLGVPTPRFLGYLHPVEGCMPDFMPLTSAEALESMLAASPCSKICFKPSEGWGGRGFVAAEVHRSASALCLRNCSRDEPPWPVADFAARYLDCTQGLVVEEYLEQHEVLRAFNPSSVNTLRIWLKQKEGEVTLLGVIARIGRRGAVVDNAGQGGFIVQVDPCTGVLGDVLTTGIIQVRSTQHPDSGLRLSGQQLPFWPECVALAKRSLLVFPHARFTGLDMAISPIGPVIIELNLEPDKVTARNFRAPLADLLS